MLIVRKLANGRLRHYVFIMHAHTSKICSSTKILILPHVALIRIFFWYQHLDINPLPDSLIN